MPVSTEKDFQSKIEKLENWLASKEGPLKLTPHESSLASGFSNETFVFDLEKENSVETLVLRLEPTEYQVFPNYDLPMQASIMKVLRGKNMLTPEVIYENYDDNILGSGFYIMKSIFKISGMTCNGCKLSVEDKLSSIYGVDQAM